MRIYYARAATFHLILIIHYIREVSQTHRARAAALAILSDQSVESIFPPTDLDSTRSSRIYPGVWSKNYSRKSAKSTLSVGASIEQGSTTCARSYFARRAGVAKLTNRRDRNFHSVYGDRCAANEHRRTESPTIIKPRRDELASRRPQPNVPIITSSSLLARSLRLNMLIAATHYVRS